MLRLHPRSTALVLLAACGACSGTVGRGPEEPEPVVEVFVSPAGNDAGSGTKKQPYKTIGTALDSGAKTVTLVGGQYKPADLTLTQPVHLQAEPSGDVRILSPVSIASSGVQLSRLTLAAGLDVRFGEAVLRDLKISAGDRDEALSVTSSTLNGRGLRLECGPESCIDFTKSEGVLGDVEAVAKATKRVLRTTGSTIAVNGARLVGGSIAQVHITDGGRADLVGIVLERSRGNGVAALRGANVHLQKSRISDAAKFALVVQNARVAVSSSTLSASPDLTVGLSGGVITLRDTHVEAGASGAISVTNHPTNPSTLELEGGSIAHGALPAILLGSGTIRARGTRFNGAAGSKADEPEAAITATGVHATLELLDVWFDRPAGYAVHIDSDAQLTMTGTVTAPRSAALLATNAAASVIRLRGLRIQKCRADHGLVLLASKDVELHDIRIAGCKESGILLGDETVATLSGLVLAGNRRYGLAAFGRSVAHVSDASVEGAKFGAFAMCADGSWINETGDNRWGKLAVLCP